MREASHEEDGQFPMVVKCDLVPEGFLLGVLRDGPHLAAIFYFAENSYASFAPNYGMTLLELGWRHVEGSSSFPTIIGKTYERDEVVALSQDLQTVINLIDPTEIRTGNLADPTYSCSCG
jgi:hypothetical protein